MPADGLASAGSAAPATPAEATAPAPELTLGGLAAEAARLVRARCSAALVRPRPGSAPRLARSRTVLRSWIYVGLIVVLSAGAASLVWQALADLELRSSGQSRTTGADLERRSQTDDQERTLTRRLERDRSAGTSGQTTSGSQAPDASASASGGFTVSGPILGFAGSGGVLAAGVGAGLLILRRTRRDSDPVPGTSADLSVPPATAEQDELADEAGTADTEEEQDGDATASADDVAVEPQHIDAADGDLADPSAGEAVDALNRPPGTGPGHENTRTTVARSTGPGGESTAPLLPRQRSAPTASVTDALGTHLISLTDAPVAASIKAGSTYDSGQRIFERRQLPRVAVCFKGVLQHKDVEWAVTVLDLSESGLRCRLDDAGTRQPPKSRDDVRLAFRANGQMIPIRGQVAWRRHDEQGYEVGVAFVTPPGPVAEQLTNLCLNGTPAD